MIALAFQCFKSLILGMLIGKYGHDVSYTFKDVRGIEIFLRDGLADWRFLARLSMRTGL